VARDLSTKMLFLLRLKGDWMTIPDLVKALNRNAVESARHHIAGRLVESFFGTRVLEWLCHPSRKAIEQGIGAMIYLDNCTAVPISDVPTIPRTTAEGLEPKVKLKISKKYIFLMEKMLEGPTPANRRSQIGVVTIIGPTKE
jgi:hypothetical protein